MLVTQNKIHLCPECNHKLKCMVALGADETVSGQEERFMHCENCLSSWVIAGDYLADSPDIHRYFFG